MYTAKYKSKVPASVNHAVPIMYATQRRMTNQKSTARDAGTPDRNFQFMVTQLLELEFMPHGLKPRNGHVVGYMEDGVQKTWIQMAVNPATNQTKLVRYGHGRRDVMVRMTW